MSQSQTCTESETQNSIFSWSSELISGKTGRKQVNRRADDDLVIVSAYAVLSKWGGTGSS